MTSKLNWNKSKTETAKIMGTMVHTKDDADKAAEYLGKKGYKVTVTYHENYNIWDIYGEQAVPRTEEHKSDAYKQWEGVKCGAGAGFGYY